MITNNKYRAMRNNLVSKEKIKSEDSSLRVENTSEDLRASISCIESSKLSQETRQGYNYLGKATLLTIDRGIDLMLHENNSFSLNGTTHSSANIDFEVENFFGTVTIEFNRGNVINSFGADYVRLLLYHDDEVLNDTNLIGKTYYTINLTEEVNKVRLWIQIGNTFDNSIFYPMIYAGDYDASKKYEQYGQSPSTKFKSEVEGITGDVNLKVQNKNYAQNIKYLNQSTAIYPVIKCDIYYKKNKYYIVSFKTPNTGDTVYLNHGTGWGIRRVTSTYAVYCDGTRKFYIIQALETAFRKDINYINKTNQFLDKSTGLLSEFMIEEIDAITDEEALKCVYSNYVEHQEKNFVISLGDKTLYKSDKIVRKEGKWYFALKWAVINDFSKLIKNSTSDGMFRASLELSNKIVDISDLNSNKGYSNILKTVNNGATYHKIEGFTVNLLNNKGNPILWIYINSFDNYTAEEYIQALNDLNAYFIVPLKEEELELIENETLINQLDAILLNLYEYDDVTNFDFDNDVTFEITVEKDKLRILENRLDKAEENTTNAEILALEKEDN